MMNHDRPGWDCSATRRRAQGRRAGWLAGLTLLLAGLTAGTDHAAADVSEQVREALGEPATEHPRLFLHEDEVDRVRTNIDADPLLERAWHTIRDQADAMLNLEPSEREQVGRRLLGVSRTVLKRVSYLSLAYRLTDEPRYLERAEQEMLAVADFSDWNPSHFLDVAEMTAALAIGYDWLHEDLPADSRETIRAAIVEKGLRTSIDEAGWWVRTTNNWSQVCHGGLTMGALVVMEHEPELAEQIITRALENIHRPMNVYGPNGAYPEGAGYWSYGTSFNVLLIDALRSALGSDFGLTDHEPFMASPRYYLHVHGSTRRVFNYSDNSESSSVSPEMYWFARQLDEPSLLAMERRKLARFVKGSRDADGAGNRLLAMLPVWTPPLEEVDPPQQRHYHDTGEAPIGIHRTGWDEAASFVGIKAGSPSTNHGQMDTGSFVMEADGVRWAVDLGVQSYHSLESEGVELWNSAQDGGRWTVFRLNNRSKNTLVVDDELQRVNGVAPIVSFVDEGPMPHTVVDLAEVYDGQLAEAVRGVGLREEDGAVVVQDELRGPDDRSVEVRWGMVTRAEVEIVDDDRAVLREDGETLGLDVSGGSSLEIYNTEDPPRDYDARNPGTRMIGFKVTLDADEARSLIVRLTPGGPTEQPIEVKPLEQW